VPNVVDIRNWHTVIHAREKNRPAGREPIDWKLATDMPVRTRTDAIEKLRWYALRWKIELFHYTLKSGCRIEQSYLRTAQRCVNLIALCCIISWRIFWLTMIRHSAPRAPSEIAFTTYEKAVLAKLSQRWSKPLSHQSCLADYLTCLARLGGYLARTHDPPPGNLVIWRSMRRLSDLTLGGLPGHAVGWKMWVIVRAPERLQFNSSRSVKKYSLIHLWLIDTLLMKQYTISKTFC